MAFTPRRQFALQAAAVFLVLSLAWPYYGMRAEALPWREVSLAMGGLAFGLASLTRQPLWWRLIHAGFMPLAWWVASFNIDPGWFLLGFILLLLVYRGALTGQVPLYLSRGDTVEALAELIADRPRVRFLDLGAGLASTVSPLAQERPDSHFTGIENAPLTWLGGWLRSRGQANVAWRWGDLWATPLGDYDVVYAFLSPAPMAELWRKVQAEMAPGSLFVSNSFPVPDAEPEQIVETAGVPARPLYCYRL